MGIQPNVGYAMMAVGAVKATEHALGFLRGVWKHCLRPRRWLKSRYARPGVEPWVVISGAASGIGKGYALELAKDGFNIFFIDKHEEDSIATKKELHVTSSFMTLGFWEVAMKLTILKLLWILHLE